MWTTECVWMYMYVYTHIQIHIYTYIYVHIYICVYVHVYIYVYVRIYVFIYIYIYVHIYMYWYTHTHMRAHTHTHAHIYMCTHVQRSTRVHFRYPNWLRTTSPDHTWYHTCATRLKYVYCLYSHIVYTNWLLELIINNPSRLYLICMHAQHVSNTSIVFTHTSYIRTDNSVIIINNPSRLYLICIHAQYVCNTSISFSHISCAVWIFESCATTANSSRQRNQQKWTK